MTSGGTTWTNTYNSDGLRTSRTDGTTTYTYYYEGGRLSAIKRNDLNMWIIYDENGPVTLKYGAGTFHYVTNLQGDVVAIVGNQGQKLVEYTYDAWGKVTSITGDYAYNLGIHNPILYRGYIYDHETGLYYCQSRYYDPEIGRFINADAFTSTGQGLLGNNMFAYCGNNPVNYEDPSGLSFLPCVSYFDGEGGGYPIWTNLADTPEEQTRGMINGQGRLPYSSNSIGLGSYGYSGCPYIAVYNAMQLTGNARSLHSITQDFLYKHGVVLFGALGAGPWNIESYIKSQGINYTSSCSVSDLTANISEGSVIIFTVWNDRLDITSGWHAMTALYAKGQYWVFNQYNNSTTYAVFPSLGDAFAEGMWLHGIRID